MVPSPEPYSTGKDRIEAELRCFVCLLPHVT